MSKETLDKLQLQAFNNAMENDISIISGLAGSGKSHTAQVISKQLLEDNWTVSRVAPTGKAALRIKGQTIHSWLVPVIEEDKWGNVKVIGFGKDSFEPKECLIVDEASMIDDKLWHEIMIRYEASNSQKKIIFVGDIGQLEPVGDGTPYIDIINKNEHPNTLLTKIHRNKDGNDIVDFAHSIRNGRNAKPVYLNVHSSNRTQAIKAVYDDLEHVQILSPMKKGVNGTKELNLEIQKLFNRTKKVFNKVAWDNVEKGWKATGDAVYIGDKIVITRNRFDLKLTNGTVGIITSFAVERMFNPQFKLWEDVDGFKIKRDFDEKELFVPLMFATKNVDLAYSLTVHKFQGSEINKVYFMATPDQSFMLRDKKLLYTAVTRASEELHIVSG